MLCRKCGKSFPYRIDIDGKRRNLSNRKFCFECSPFGAHNTSAFITKVRHCRTCGKEIVRKNEKGTRCWVCTNKNNRQIKIERIKGFTGDACWICGYNKCWQAMDFHHVNREDKLFELTSREIQYAWDRIFEELKKCVLLCCRCHREVHAKLITDSFINDLWLSRWKEITDNKTPLIV
jgi:hypothetical protein